MPPNQGVIKDTVTGNFCKTYNADVDLCVWDTEDVAEIFPTLSTAQSAADNLNGQVVSDRYIGQNPKPR